MMPVPTSPAASSLFLLLVPSLSPLGFTRMEPLFFQPDKTAFVPQSVYFTSLALLFCGVDFITLAERAAVTFKFLTLKALMALPEKCHCFRVYDFLVLA